jgi:nucleotide-binding universal stress UspA family protein
MFKHLLVPLDGSRLAEAALPAAAFLAGALGASVVLTHVIERDAPQEVHGQRHLADADEARAYLDEVAGRAFHAGAGVEQHVHSAAESDVARSIVAHADELASDLIVMSTHGHGGLRTWLFGSIAQQIIGLGTTPVLLIQPSRKGTAPGFACKRLLVPLDCDADHEQGLWAAASLAPACNAELHLVMVVPTPATLSGRERAGARVLPGVTSALLELDEEGARAYLARCMTDLKAKGVPASAQVRRGDAARVIVRTARQVRADLIVLGTHGRSGMEAFWSESVAPQVISRSHLPLLLVPVRELGAESEGTA